MEEKTLFPREEKSEILFKKISEDKWACEKLMETFWGRPSRFSVIYRIRTGSF